MNCQKLLAKASCGTLQIKCPRCKQYNNLTAKSCEQESHRASSTQGKHCEKLELKAR